MGFQNGNLTKKESNQLKKDIQNLLDNSSVNLNNNGLDFTNVTCDDPNFDFISCGCSSAVFRSKRFPFIAVKIYSHEHRQEASLEAYAYKKLNETPYFPRLYLQGPNYLVIEYIEGKSLYDCIIDGTEVPEDITDKVDYAISLAQSKGLKPSDIHFKNVLVKGQNITLIDLSDYVTAKHMSRWSKLRFFYKTIYKPFFKGSKIPQPVVNIIRKTFRKAENFLR